MLGGPPEQYTVHAPSAGVRGDDDRIETFEEHQHHLREAPDPEQIDEDRNSATWGSIGPERSGSERRFYRRPPHPHAERTPTTAASANPP